MKSYEEFKSLLKTELERAGIETKTDFVKKANYIYETFMPTNIKDGVFATFDLEKGYDLYVADLKKGVSEERIIARLLDSYLNPPMYKFNLKEKFEYAIKHPKIEMQLISAEENKDLLKNAPHRRWLDLAVIYYLEINAEARAFVNNDLMQDLNMTEAQLFEKGYETLLDNTRLRTISVWGNVIDINIDDINKFVEEGFIILDTCSSAGATTMLNAEILAQIADKFDSNIYILPSSIHEVLIVKQKGIEANNLKFMVKEVNSNVVETKDFLSNNVYIYDRSEKEVRIA